MAKSLQAGFIENFLGQSPIWYKKTILAFLIINPIAYMILDPFVVGWMFIIEFIFTLAMALKCYPLQPGGLLAIEALILGLTKPEAVFIEVEQNFKVILLLMFMVAGIYFMKDLLLVVFTKLLVNVRNQKVLALLFCILSALLSAFLDALTVVAVVISVSVGFYSVYHKLASGREFVDADTEDGADVPNYNKDDLDNFRAFLRGLLMHAAVGTALGGVATTVGEPQNLLIADKMGWDFVEFYLNVMPVSLPALLAGLATCLFVEQFKLFGYGTPIPQNVLTILKDYDVEMSNKRDKKDVAKLIVQGISAVLLVAGLGLHVAEVGLIGLAIIVLQTAFNGITEEHALGHAFEEALPFTALLVVFFSIVAIIHSQHLFEPITHFALSFSEDAQPGVFFAANAVLSMISDNVFVATVYIGEVQASFEAGEMTRQHFEHLAVAINTGTNLPSVATPNGQAAFLFLLTSSLAPLVRLSYGKMVLMALPYTIVLSVVGFYTVSTMTI
ncbi:MAG: sodium/proton antiporter NhaB [Pseudomonadota bacterium]|nr:sodium/proton antiporter NhaB [Pseudomonadota bacterium]